MTRWNKTPDVEQKAYQIEKKKLLFLWNGVCLQTMGPQILFQSFTVIEKSVSAKKKNEKEN